MRLAFCSVLLTLSILGWAYGENRELAYANAFSSGVFALVTLQLIIKRVDEYMNGRG